ncbi:TonB-dependent receptor [Agarilytica rhodophyticola]|uniref:TonB-dependent receptor n=1 Tax=Agarilytica rhodophyticola TaxID=1737490 RepID=UPI000B341027|nr:TonB-dependent receptor [Agarilytica rhodophyticola]
MSFDVESNIKSPQLKNKLAVAIAGILTLSGTSASYAQTEGQIEEEVIVTGIRASLSRAQDVKREASTLVDAIAAEDLGKFPDLNVAESLQRITGVSIDRSGGEGQQVSVRGFGPQFNMVLVNGRQIATDSPGREFNFDVLAADQITGADIYKSSAAHLQEGGIGATIDVKTARPFDNPGFQFVGSVKGVYETLSEETAPSVSALVSNTFADDTFGVLLALSRQERKVQINRIETAGWRPGLDLTNNGGDTDPDTVTTVATNVFLPRNWDQIVDEQDRERTNANLVLQFAPNDDITITLDGYISKFEVDSLTTDLASWFEPDRVGAAEVDANGTVLNFTQRVGLDVSSGAPRTDLVSHTRNGRDVNNKGFGLNVDYAINDNFTMTFDASTSDAENDQAGRQRFNVIGIDNNYEFDIRSGFPVVTHDGFGNGALPDESLARAHFNRREGFTDEDEITEFKVDFEYESDSEVFQKLKFGAYNQSREKSRFQKLSPGAGAFGGYHLPIPNGLLRPFTANNFFSGLIDTFYTYDGEAYFDFLELPQSAIDNDIAAGNAPGTTAAALGGSFDAVLQNDRYTIEEDITSLYIDATFGFNIGDMPLTVNAGLRYAETDIDITGVQSALNDIIPTSDRTLFARVEANPTDITQGTDYSDVLPSLNLRLDVTDDIVVRSALYQSLTRPTLSQLSPVTVFGEPRRQNLTANGGNPELEPFTADNFDFSVEWYYTDVSYASFTYFRKDVENFIVTLTGAETVTLADRAGQPDDRCSVSNSNDCSLPFVLNTPELFGQTEVFNVSRPQNGPSAEVDGVELALTHVWDIGVGVTVNATFVDSDADVGTDTTQSFGLEGLGDSQNVILFYEQGPFQARIAFNNREGFLRQLDNGFNGEPINTRTFGQWDMSASYDINDNFTVFFEGINITEEELEQTGRFDNQIFSIEDNGSRYSLGGRYKF